ncbi:hypothetical protein H0H87_004914 [Tephrocybe sp. NHM501043]|nr:hypothetical protein H0H87_004914 [Tephrocybe sp. NHM501043]
MRLTSLSFLLVLAVPSLCSTAEDVLADLTVLKTNLESTNNAITALPPDVGSIGFRTPSQLLALSPSPVNDTDGRAILDSLLALEPSVNDSTDKLIERTKVVAALPTIPLMGNPLAMAKASIASFKAALTTLEDAAEVAAPPSLLAEGQALRGRFDANMDRIIAAYTP